MRAVVMAAEEEIPISKRRRIEETVVNILKISDLETATELSVREAAAQQLSIDLSDFPHKCLVRRVLESFLISTASVAPPPPAPGGGAKDRQFRDDKQLLSSPTSDGRVICNLSNKRKVTVHDFNGKPLVSLRDYYEKDGKQIPSGGGISLTGRQWTSFRSSFAAIEEAIAKLEAKIRLAAVEKQSGTDVLCSLGDIASQGTVVSDQNKIGQNIWSSEDAVNLKSGKEDVVGMVKDEPVTSPDKSPMPRAEFFPSDAIGLKESQNQQQRDREHDVNCPMVIPTFQEQTDQRHQPEADACNVSAFASQGDISHSWTAASPQSLIPVMTARLDGKNYHSWVHLMEFFLNQLKVGYVLKQPCPSVSAEEMSFEEVIKTKASIRKWVDDEYICRHYVLNSLCDNLFSQYSKKGYSAKELWEELKSVYDEDFGTVKSQVNKYIHFEMVDGISVLDQVQELQRILNNIMASGIWVAENFHVCAIISKLPPSWNDYCAKLMHGDGILPYNVLMHQLKLEEESRNQCMKESLSRNCRYEGGAPAVLHLW